MIVHDSMENKTPEGSPSLPFPPDFYANSGNPPVTMIA